MRPIRRENDFNQLSKTPELPLTIGPRIVEQTHSLTRRSFCRSLALSAGALGLGSGERAWAGADSAKIKCETKVLWDFNGCIEHRFMGRINTHVYKGNAYLWVLLPGLKTMIVKVPLAGGTAEMFPLMPGHVTGDDPHRFYTISADSLGYIHICGDMHSSAYVKHWVSKRPEDISEFVYTSTDGENKRPQGYNVTYPNLIRSPDGVLYHFIRCADPVWGVGISVLDVNTQTWTMLGADVPDSELHGNRARKKTKGKPMTVWEDNGEGGDYGYTLPYPKLVWDKNKRMHLAVCLLNENTPSSKGRHTASDIVYAYSDDGGKTFNRGDGSPIRLPMRAEPGPYQADVVYSRRDGPPPWVALSPGLTIDANNRPVIIAVDYKSGPHRMVLEKGKWTEVSNSGEAAAGKGADDDDDDDDSDVKELRKWDLPYAPHNPDSQSMREAGAWVYTAFPERDRYHNNNPRYHRVMLLMSKLKPAH